MKNDDIHSVFAAIPIKLIDTLKSQPESFAYNFDSEINKKLV